MIFKVLQCGGGKQFGYYLICIDDNEYVEIYEIRGFVLDDVIGVFKEFYVVSKGIKCK